MKKINAKQYAQALLKISNAPDLDKILEIFLSLLKRNGHISKLSEILNCYKILAQEKKEGAEARLSLATSENQEEIARMAGRIKISGIEKFKIKPEADKNLLGGFILRVKDALIDASLKKQINNLRKSLSN